MEKEFNMDDIYIGLECKDEYSEFLEEYELWKEHIIMEKSDYYLSVGDITVNVYRNVDTGEQLYIDSNGFVINSKDEITGEKVYHRVCNIISVRDLLEKYKLDVRNDCQYRRYVMPLYQKVSNLFKSKKTITLSELNTVFGNLNDIHTYLFDLIEEDEYEDLFGCRVYSFDTGKRM